MKILFKNDLSILLHSLSGSGYVLIGPRLKDNAIVYDEIKGIDDLPSGWGDEQDAGKYRIKKRKDNALFAHTTAIQSLKNFVPLAKALGSAKKSRV
jgi:hypothetical protein